MLILGHLLGSEVQMLIYAMVPIPRQPKILQVFSQLWGTEDLIASFDGLNVTHPVNDKTGRKDIKPTEAWPRMLKSAQLRPGPTR